MGYYFNIWPKLKPLTGKERKEIVKNVTMTNHSQERKCCELCHIEDSDASWRTTCRKVDCRCHQNKCDCVETSCKEGCARQHTHKGFSCEKCTPQENQPAPTEKEVLATVDLADVIKVAKEEERKRVLEMIKDMKENPCHAFCECEQYCVDVERGTLDDITYKITNL